MNLNKEGYDNATVFCFLLVYVCLFVSPGKTPETETFVAICPFAHIPIAALLSAVWSLCCDWQLGTLGAGNHYAEIQVVDDIYNEYAARKMGIDHKGQVCVMIHSGSRGLGHQVATGMVRLAWVPGVKQTLQHVLVNSNTKRLFSQLSVYSELPWQGLSPSVFPFLKCWKRMCTEVVGPAFLEIFRTWLSPWAALSNWHCSEQVIVTPRSPF